MQCAYALLHVCDAQRSPRASTAAYPSRCYWFRFVGFSSAHAAQRNPPVAAEGIASAWINSFDVLSDRYGFTDGQKKSDHKPKSHK